MNVPLNISTSTINLIPTAVRFKPRQISILLTVLALALWAFSLTQAKLVIDDWGIIHSLSISYFIAMALLTMASGILWLSKESHNFLLGFQLCFFIAMLWLTPLILGTTPLSTRYAFSYYSNTQYVINFGHLNTSTEWTHNWPSLPLLETALVEILGIKNADSMLISVSFILQIIMVLPLYLFLRNLMERSNYRWAAIWIFYLFNHVGQFFFNHQILALFLIWTILALLVGASDRKEIKTPAYHIVITILLVCLTMTHLLTSITCLAIIAILWITRRRKLSEFVILLSVLILSWTMYVATSFFEGYTPKVAGKLFRLDLLWQMNISQRMTGSEEHLMVVNIRLLLTALIGVIGFAGLVLSRKFKSTADSTVLAIAGGILLTLPFGFYETEMIFRAYLFLLPVLAYFGMKLYRIKISSFIVIILLVVALPLSIISLHGNQSQDHTSLSQRAYWHFIEDKTTEGRFTGGGMVRTWSLDYLGDQIFDPSLHASIIEEGNQWRNDLFTGKWPPNGAPAYIGLSSYEEALYRIWHDDSQFIPEVRSWLSNSTSYDLIFASGDVTSYIKMGKNSY